MNETAYLSTRQLAARWGYHQESIRRLLREGRLPVVRFGKRALRVSMQAVQAYEMANQVERQVAA